MINIPNLFQTSHLWKQERYKYAKESDFHIEIAKQLSEDYEQLISDMILDHILLEEYEENIFKSDLPLFKKLKLTKITKMDVEQVNSILDQEYELFIEKDHLESQELYLNSYC